MVIEYRIVLDGTSHPVIISDEPLALLTAQAAGRAIIGVEENEHSPRISFAPYIIPSFEDVGRELAELVLRRHLGLPWTIAVTKRLLVREFVKEDADLIPREEYGGQEKVFRSREMMALYIEKQYGFYEYGTWALTEKQSGLLVGMAGVSNPRLSPAFEKLLEQARPKPPDRQMSWLELGYHVFAPFRRRGYAKEAAGAIASYAHEVLDSRLIALIDRKNKASRALAAGLGMECIKETGIQSWKGRLLYAEHWRSQPDRGAS